MRRSTGLALVTAVIMTLVCAVTALGYDGRILERGMEGHDVKEIQQVLKSLGYEIKPDGVFGPATERAVRTFQQENGIVADGIVGPQTLRALRDAGFNQVHRVQRGDTLISLARLYGTSIDAIMDANDLTDETIYVGQKLVIPARSEQTGSYDREDEVAVKAETDGERAAMMTYRVQRGESTYIIARKFNTTVDAIAKANNLRDPSRLQVGQELLIPSISAGVIIDSMIWPARGPISSGYGWRTHPIYKHRQFHGGIDIAVPKGTGIRAAAAGKVIRADDMGGFGLGVVIEHGSGITTWYGHNSRLLVKAGEEVEKGQIIARSGSTGTSTGPHLDFRIKVNGNTVNPLYWLP